MIKYLGAYSVAIALLALISFSVVGYSETIDLIRAIGWASSAIIFALATIVLVAFAGIAVVFSD